MNEVKKFYFRMWLSGILFFVLIVSFQFLQDRGAATNLLLIVICICALAAAPLVFCIERVRRMLGLQKILRSRNDD
jgi:hypothetical protein